MEELFLETKNGNVPINQDMIKKYHLQKGTRSPFTNGRIVGKNGKYVLEKPKKKAAFQGDGIAEMGNGLALSTSEMIDFTQGADSSTEET